MSHGLDAGSSPERIGLGMEVSGMQIPEGPAVGANNNNAYGANGMLVPERAGLVSEVSRGSRDGPSVGEKILPSLESRVEGKSGGNKSHCCDFFWVR